jgi:MFS family permease
VPTTHHRAAAANSEHWRRGCDDHAVALWRNRHFSVFWAAQTISFAGTQVSEFAIPLTAALTLGAGAAQMGVLGAAELLPPLVLGLPAGIVVDRSRRASLLVWCSAGQALLLATIPLAAGAGLLGLPQLITVAFLTAALALVYGLAATAYLPVLVDRGQLLAANSAVTLSDTVPSIVGPGVAGVLVQLLTAPIAVAADAVSFVVAAALLLGARRPDQRPQPGERAAASLRDGFAAFVARPGLWAPTAALGSHGLFYGGILALIVLYAVRDLGLTPAELGLAYAISTFGPLLAGIAAAPAVRRLGVRWTPVAATALFAANFLTPLAGGPLWLVIAMLAGRGLVGLAAVFMHIVRSTVLQQSVPAELTGRVNAVINVVEWGPVPVGSLLGGVLGQVIGLRPALFALATGGVIASLPCVVVPAIRNRFAPVER